MNMYIKKFENVLATKIKPLKDVVNSSYDLYSNDMELVENYVKMVGESFEYHNLENELAKCNIKLDDFLEGYNILDPALIDYKLLGSLYYVNIMLRLNEFTDKDRHRLVKYFIETNIRNLHSTLQNKDLKIVNGRMFNSSVTPNYVASLLNRDYNSLSIEDKALVDSLYCNYEEDLEKQINTKETFMETYRLVYLKKDTPIREIRDALHKISINGIVEESIVNTIIEFRINKSKKEEKKQEIVKKRVIKPDNNTISQKTYNTLVHSVKDIYDIEEKTFTKEKITFDDMTKVVAVLISIKMPSEEIISFITKSYRAIRKMSIIDNYDNYLRDKIEYLYPEQLEEIDMYYNEAKENEEEWKNLFKEEIDNLIKDEYLYEIHKSLEYVKK